VFRARAAVFAELTWLILVSAWEFKDLRRSMFRLNPEDASGFSVFRDLYANQFLFWAVIVGAISVFPVVYIPKLNTNVFKHTAIGWEWALVVSFTVLFVAGVEAWKFVKRTFRLLEDHPVRKGPFAQGGEDDTGGRNFSKTMSFSSFKSWRSTGRSDTGDSGLVSNERARSRRQSSER
jgi:magnesium-transporting ATPase (P-type)